MKTYLIIFPVLLVHPEYKKIKTNVYCNGLKREKNIGWPDSCTCDARIDSPCGPSSQCINRALFIECSMKTCPAGPMCNNQNFRKRNYIKFEIFKTGNRGWGVKTLESLQKGTFIIECIGEIVSLDEFTERMKKTKESNQLNYYFLKLNNTTFMDLAFKSNEARFVNHSCDPNCELQKWTVNGEDRLGLFAKTCIRPGSELTFHYNFTNNETIESVACYCGAKNCSKYIGKKS